MSGTDDEIEHRSCDLVPPWHGEWAAPTVLEPDASQLARPGPKRAMGPRSWDIMESRPAAVSGSMSYNVWPIGCLVRGLCKQTT